MYCDSSLQEDGAGQEVTEVNRLVVIAEENNEEILSSVGLRKRCMGYVLGDIDTIVTEFDNTFSFSLDSCTTTSISIDMGGASPIRQYPYRIPDRL